MFCTSCGASLPGQARFCNKCGQAVAAPPPGSPPGAPAAYELIPGEFEHPSMQQMNQALRRSLVLNRMAEGLSQKIGKPWYESCFNSVEVNERQYARVFELAGIAARRIGFARVPDVYIEADRGHQSNTYGSERDSFVNIGTFLPKLLTDRELLFVLGHEFGHLKCRHALWTTASMFLVGQARGNLMSEGIMSYVSNPLKILEGGVESAISSWMRVAELTADRAALLVTGDIALARRTLFLLYFRSRRELEEVDVDAWTRQQEAQASTMTKVSQLLTSSTPYLGLRLRALEEFHASPRYAELKEKVDRGSGLDLALLFDEKGYLKKFAKPGPTSGPARVVTGTCPHCRASVRIPLAGLPSQGKAQVTCGQCGRAFPLDMDRLLGSKPADPPAPDPRPIKDRSADPDRRPGRRVQALEGGCPACGRRFALPVAGLPDKPAMVIPCRGCGKRFRVGLDAVRRQDLREPEISGASLPEEEE